MTTSEKPGAEERQQQLVKLRRKMGKVLRRGDTAEYDRLTSLYGRLKGEHAQLVHEEYVAERRAAVAARRAQEQAEREARKPWRLPRGFGASPLAQQRAREGRPVAPMVPDSRRPALNPWRRGSSMSEIIWRPPS